MRLAIKNLDHAVELLVAYNGGRRSAREEAELLEDGVAYAARDFKRLGHERYYRESEAIKYDLLRWHLKTARWQLDFAFLGHMHRPGTLVDFGAGVGLSAFTYASAGLEVTAVEADLESDTVRFARFLMRELGIEGVRYSDRIPEGPEDNVVSVDVFEHLPDWTGAARRLVRALRPGGVFCMRASFGTEETDPDHPQHFDSPVPVEPFLRSLGLANSAGGVWVRAG